MMVQIKKLLARHFNIQHRVSILPQVIVSRKPNPPSPPPPGECVKSKGLQAQDPKTQMHETKDKMQARPATAPARCSEGGKRRGKNSVNDCENDPSKGNGHGNGSPPAAAGSKDLKPAPQPAAGMAPPPAASTAAGTALTGTRTCWFVICVRASYFHDGPL